MRESKMDNMIGNVDNTDNLNDKNVKENKAMENKKNNMKRNCKRAAAGALAIVVGTGLFVGGHSIVDANSKKDDVKAVSNSVSNETEGKTNSNAVSNEADAQEVTNGKVKVDSKARSKNQGDARYTKDENIYGILKQDGSIDNMYVVNQFEVTKAGYITDLGIYEDVENLTNTEEVEIYDGKIKVYADKGNFYYQGTNCFSYLPWDFDINYYLNGEKADIDELKGADGEVKIKIKSSKNEEADDTFYENYMLQVSLTLDNEKAKNVVCGDATVADAGESRQYNYTVMPEDDANITLKADVTDFEMDGISIAAIPFTMSVDMPDSDSMLKGMSKLSDGVNDLDDGVGELRDGVNEYVDGISEFNDALEIVATNLEKVSDGGNELSDGSSKIAEGLEKVSEGGSGLIEGSKQINDTLKLLAGKISTMDLSGLSKEDAAFLTQVVAGLSQNYGRF